MKTLIIILSITLYSLPIFSQLKLGVKTSYGFDYTASAAKEHYSFDQGLLYNIGFVANKNCFTYGLGSYAEIGNLFFSADFMFRKCYTELTLHTIDKARSESNQTYEDEYSVFHLPISAGVRINNLKLGFGPVLNLMLDSDLALSEMEGFEVRGAKLKPGFQFVFGFIIKETIHLDLKSEIAFSKAADHYYINGNPSGIKSTPRLVSLNLGFFL